MPPLNPPLKSDGPACRVCGCTEHNACVIQGESVRAPVAKAVRIPASRMPRLLTCSWTKVEPASQSLCSACSGTPADMREVFARGLRFMQGRMPMDAKIAIMKRIATAAIARLDARAQLEKDRP